MNSTNEYIFSLIAARLCGEKLLPQEEKDLEDWLCVRPEHPELYQYYQDLFEKKERLRLWADVKVPEKVLERIFRSQFPFRRIMTWLAACAAVIGLLILINPRLWRPEVVQEKKVAAMLVRNDIAPGKQKAQLKLDDGEVIALSDSSMAIHSHQNIQVGNGGVLEYTARSTAEKIKAVYHTLVVARGGEFQLILPDGTKVWLNSASELKYPNIFNQDTRQVYLKGEAYFEVKHNDRQPFIVTAGDCSVQVLGTSFNISSYPDDEHVAITLVTGKIAYTAGNTKGELSPGQQCIYDHQKGTAIVTKVEIDQYVSWKNGLFIFDRIRMEELAKQLARWYDVEVFFPDDAARYISFTGAMERYKPVSYFIEMLNETNTVACQLEGNRLVFRQKLSDE